MLCLFILPVACTKSQPKEDKTTDFQFILPASHCTLAADGLNATGDGGRRRGRCRRQELTREGTPHTNGAGATAKPTTSSCCCCKILSLKLIHQNINISICKGLGGIICRIWGRVEMSVGGAGQSSLRRRHTRRRPLLLPGELRMSRWGRNRCPAYQCSLISS